MLCEKFAHTRFEPSGWTGNEQIGYAKSVMDYLFRWMQLRFLSGHQLDLFAGLTPPTSVPVQGSVNAPANTVLPSPAQQNSAAYGESERNNSVILSEAEGPAVASSGRYTYGDHDEDRTPPQGGIAPDLQARSGLESSSPSSLGPSPLSLEDRGIYHASDAMKDLYDMGDSPSCSTCGSIMTRNGSCYRCMRMRKHQRLQLELEANNVNPADPECWVRELPSARALMLMGYRPKNTVNLELISLVMI